MSETMILVAGRSSDQGTALNKGKLKDDYHQVTSTVEMNEDDMARLGLQAGDMIRLSNEVGEATVSCQPRKRTDLPAGMLFIAYGPSSSQLMASDTAGSGMPISKNFLVRVQKAAASG